MGEAVEVVEDLADHGEIENEGDDFHFCRAPAGGEGVRFEDLLEKPRPAPRSYSVRALRCGVGFPRITV